MLEVALSLVLAAGPSLALAAPTPENTVSPKDARERSQALLAEGDAEFERGAFDQAISKYAAAYYDLTPTDRASYLGSIPIRKAMRAYAERIGQEEDPEVRRQLLERQRALVDEFLFEVSQRERAVDEVGQDLLDKLEETRQAIEQTLQAVAESPEPEPEPEPEPKPEPEPPSAAPTVQATEADSPRLPRDKLGLGLVIGGGVLFGTGVGFITGRWTVPYLSKRDIETHPDKYEYPTPELKAMWLENEVAGLARTYLITGSVIAGVGLATAVGGVVRLVVHRRKGTQTARTHVAPTMAPSAAGLTLLHRF